MPRSRRLEIALLILLCAALPATFVQAALWRVPDDAPTIAAGLDSSAVGDTVLVACGSYTESDLVMKSGVVLRGETGLPDCVDWDALDAAGHLFMSGADEATIIEGFTFRNGWGTYTDQLGDFGGALRCESSSPLIRHCDFLENDAVYGGAIFVNVGASPQIEHCRFEGNTAVGDGAISVSSGTVTVDSCSFVSNWAFEGSGAVWGGSSASLWVRDSIFENNTTTEEGGALASRSGSWLSVERCLFEGNHSAYTAGGVELGGSGEVIDSVFRRNSSGRSGGAVVLYPRGTSVNGCVFEGNVADGYGGAIHALGVLDPPLATRVVGCTFAANEAALYGSSISAVNGMILEAERCLMAFGVRGGAVYVESGASVTASCTDIYGNADGDWAGPMASQLGVDDNFSADPLFCDAPAGDLTLRDWSPCLHRYSPCGEPVGALGMGCPATEAPPALARTVLLPNHPNPFNPRTVIPYRLAREGRVRITVHDLRGRRVAVLLDERRPAGQDQVVWSGLDGRSQAVASGVYVVRMETEEGAQQGTMALIR